MHDSATYDVIGLMSGSSLDGLDIVYAEIKSEKKYSFTILAAETFLYDEKIKTYLRDIDISKNDLTEEQHYFGALSGDLVNQFIQKYSIGKIDFIASHGHTLYHYPEKKITCQIGNGKIISEKTGLNVIYNFRQKDIDAGGQGAPLVPICDELFFEAYNACLNIGGIANISFKQEGERIGFDICAANQLLNFCAAELNMNYDADGKLAGEGKVNDELLNRLNENIFFSKPYPKSMDNNRIKKELISVLKENQLSTEDKLASVSEHIAFQIAGVVTQHITHEKINPADYHILVTGGGAFNKFLIGKIETLSGIKIHLPGNHIIAFKEALAMCLMGVLRWENKVNFLPSATGAEYAVSGGEIYLTAQD